MIKLYRHPLSGNSHRVELLLGFLGLQYEAVDVDLAAGEHRTPAFLQKNPFGKVPVLEDGDRVIFESSAILVYLARQYGDAQWLPTSPEGMADVQRWLAISASLVQEGPAAARLVTVFNANYDQAERIERAHRLLVIMETDLSRSNWLAGDHITLADVAAYTYIAHAPEGGVALDNYPSVRAWLKRVESRSGFIPMQKTAVSLAA